MGRDLPPAGAGSDGASLTEAAAPDAPEAAAADAPEVATDDANA